LSRLLPPFAGAAVAVAALAAALPTRDLTVARAAVAAAAAAALAGAVLLRARDRAGELEIQGLLAARARDDARAEDRIAELEFMAEAAIEQAERLGQRLLAQRTQLAHAEAENARLLRERARVTAEQAVRDAEESHRKAKAAERARALQPTPASYLKANAALRSLERRAAVEQAQRIAARATEVRTPATAQRPAPAAAGEVARGPRPAPAAPAVAGPAWARAALPPRPAAAVVPQRAQRRVSGARTTTGSTFSFFSRQAGAVGTPVGKRRASAAEGDLADAVGDEAYAAQRRYAQGADGPGLVDLTAEDETEQMDLRGLHRSRGN
jgi:hypothetical protein